MLEGIASDEDVKPTTRLRALEELGRIESRQRAESGAGAAAEPDADDAPDPMADLDEMEAQRVKRLRRRAS